MVVRSSDSARTFCFRYIVYGNLLNSVSSAGRIANDREAVEER